MYSDVNLNTATADELATLPGIGETLASRIVAYRERSGAFNDVDDLLAIPGITERILDGIRHSVYVRDDNDTPRKQQGPEKPSKRDGDDRGGDNSDGLVGPGKRHGGDPVRIHEEYIRYHLAGETPATAETYEQARVQFQRLPGVVQRPPAEAKLRPGDEQPDEESDEEPG